MNSYWDCRSCQHLPLSASITPSSESMTICQKPGEKEGRKKKKIRQRVSRNGHTGGHILPSPIIITYLGNILQYSMQMPCFNLNYTIWWEQNKRKAQPDALSPTCRAPHPDTFCNTTPWRNEGALQRSSQGREHTCACSWDRALNMASHKGTLRRT